MHKSVSCLFLFSLSVLYDLNHDYPESDGNFVWRVGRMQIEARRDKKFHDKPMSGFMAVMFLTNVGSHYQTPEFHFSLNRF